MKNISTYFSKNGLILCNLGYRAVYTLVEEDSLNMDDFKSKNVNTR